jgi:hypothetical protein
MGGGDRENKGEGSYIQYIYIYIYICMNFIYTNLTHQYGEDRENEGGRMREGKRGRENEGGRMRGMTEDGCEGRRTATICEGEAKKEERTEGRQAERKEGRKEERKKRRKEEGQEGKKEGRTAGRKKGRRAERKEFIALFLSQPLHALPQDHKKKSAEYDQFNARVP